MNLKLKISELSIKLDEQEQRSRNGCLLIHGVKEDKNDDTDAIALNIINEKVGVALTIDDIQRSHRVGPKVIQKRETRSSKEFKPRHRPIIVRFSNWRKRNQVFRAKKALKGQNISISENLTKIRYNLLKLATEKYGKGSTWSDEGRVIAKIDGEVIVITCEDDMI